jgi:hypothetical protein
VHTCLLISCCYKTLLAAPVLIGLKLALSIASQKDLLSALPALKSLYQPEIPPQLYDALCTPIIEESCVPLIVVDPLDQGATG